jgi:hypothetical protein
MEKHCIVCGGINNTRSEKFCSEKCRQHYHYIKNKETRSNYKKEWYKDNKEVVLEKVKEWRKNNPDKVKGYSKKYYQKKKSES